MFGVAFAILQFVPGIEPPGNMKRDALHDSLQGGGGGRAAHWVASGGGSGEAGYGSPYGQSAADTGYTTANVNQGSNSVV